MKTNIPFDYITILDDGNYGCTIELGNDIFCAICTPEWEVIEPLHNVEQDLYNDYTYVRDDDSLKISSSYFNGEYESVEEMGKRLFNDNKEGMTTDISDFDLVVYDHICSSTNTYKNDSQIAFVLFSVQYLNKKGEIAFTLENTLAPYILIETTAINEVTERIKQCGYDFEKALGTFEITGDTRNHIQQEILKVVDWADFVNHNFNDLYNLYKPIYCNFENYSDMNIMFESIKESFERLSIKYICDKGISKFPILIYLEYIKQYAPEMYQF